MAPYRCPICGKEMFPDHDCLHSDIPNFSIEMELLDLSLEPIAEPELYVIPVVPVSPKRSFVDEHIGMRAVPLFLRM